MLNPWEVIAELEADNSRLAKEAIIKRESDADNLELFRGFRAAYDAMITFGIKQVPEKAGNGRGLSADKFWNIARQLSERTLTGNAAQSAVNALRMDATEEQWNGWFRRILIKDMRCGCSDTIVNKMADKKFQVPVFSCQLAHDGANHESKIAGKKLIEVKLDGVRVLTIVYPDGKVDQYSRNGKELINFDHVKKQIAKHAVFFREPMVLDGEIMSASFQDLMKQIHRKSDTPAQDAVLNLFDIVPLREFQEGKGTQTQVQRSAQLLGWYAGIAEHMPNVTVVGQELVDLDTMQGQARFKMINTQAIAGGYEGIMVKDPEAKYETKRSVAWLKIKPFIEVSLKIVGFEEGTGKNVGRLGAIIVEGEDDGKFIRTNVGSGFSDSLRDGLWASREEALGALVEVRADAATKNQDSDDVWSLRFPRFKTFRGFVPGEKI